MPCRNVKKKKKSVVKIFYRTACQIDSCLTFFEYLTDSQPEHEIFCDTPRPPAVKNLIFITDSNEAIHCLQHVAVINFHLPLRRLKRTISSIRSASGRTRPCCSS